MKNIIIAQILRGLLIISCIFWIITGIIFITKIQVHALQYWIIMGLMMLNGVCFAIFAYLMIKKVRFIYIALMLFIVVNIILTFTDQVGIIDLAYLSFTILILILSIFRTISLFKKQ